MGKYPPLRVPGFRFEWRGKEVTEKMQTAAVEGLFDAAEHILEECSRIVPIDEGTLMRSGEAGTQSGHMKITGDVNAPRVERVSSPGRGEPPEAIVSYDTPYAARLHEHPEYSFQHGRQGKWLETVIKNRTCTIRDYIAEKIKAALRS